MQLFVHGHGHVHSLSTLTIFFGQIGNIETTLHDKILEHFSYSNFFVPFFFLAENIETFILSV